MSLLSLDERSAQVLQVGLPGAFGTFMIGSFLGILLYGVSTHQAYRYIRSFPTDAAYIRLLVILVMILETLYVIFNIHTCFHFLIWNYAHPEGLKHSTWSLDILPMLTGLVVVVAQIFFVRRVSLVGPRHRILARIVAGALVGELGFSIAATVLSFIGRPALVSVLSAAALLIASIADTILMLALVHAIRTSRSRESREASESPLDVAQVYIINSGIITGIFHYLAFITAITLPSGSLLWGAFVILAVRLYANTLLAVLNSRDLRGMEFFMSVSFSSVTLEGAHFADESDLWNTPKEKRPRAVTLGRNPPQFTDPWASATRNA
ncbi:hypothetical protein BD310DRAFT_1043003 [Dichomitus squalens]|uniref:DUF6534 domain-containing protein n=1 Tax=Dichomitus squalens TaxID=114155 RepID=A0A4Q9PGP4_9APHY|nr:hypothetical protein BD310DRAFT_1043003 [Dichomitus squalens]